MPPDERGLHRAIEATVRDILEVTAIRGDAYDAELET
jgi:hypothetical protein